MFRIVKNTRRNVKRSVSPTPKMDSAMSTFFHAESESAFLKPWLRLERGLRLQRFRAFAEEYPGLTEEEKDTLNKTLVKANDAKLLNTKQQIQYEEGKIVGIRGLKKIIGSDGQTVFKIDPTRPTKKKTISKEEGEKSAEGKSETQGTEE